MWHATRIIRTGHGLSNTPWRRTIVGNGAIDEIMEDGYRSRRGVDDATAIIPLGFMGHSLLYHLSPEQGN